MAITENALSGINGTKKKFPFTFPYLKTTDLKVELVRTTTADGTTTKTILDSTKFIFPTATEVELSSYTDGDTDSNGVNRNTWQVHGTGAPNNNGGGYTYSGKVYRSTSSDALAATFYPGSAIRSADLNDNYTQNLYVTQEASNLVTDANTDAAAAVVTADAADANATSALNNSRESDGEGGYNSAISIANTADDNADDALRATDRLVATTTDDGSTWTLAGNNTNASTDPKGVGYAVTQAEDAVDKANAASAAVAASAIYSVTADLSSLTSDSDYAINSTNHEKFVQVNDTSGITLSGGTWSDDFATSSGASFPTSFDGHSQLSLKLRINNTTSKYDVQEYYANDPEARYGEDRKVVVENNRTITDDYTIQTTMNALSVGPVSIDSGKTLTIPANSRYVVL